MFRKFWQRRRERQFRSEIRRRMVRHQLQSVFDVINQEYRYIYYEDNFATRQDFLHELVDSTDPDSYIWGRYAGGRDERIG